MRLSHPVGHIDASAVGLPLGVTLRWMTTELDEVPLEVGQLLLSLAALSPMSHQLLLSRALSCLDGGKTRGQRAEGGRGQL